MRAKENKKREIQEEDPTITNKPQIKNSMTKLKLKFWRKKLKREAINL
jgi:hypothetical protein